MPYLIRMPRAAWRKRPPNAQIKLAHPLALKLAFCWTFGNSRFADIVKKLSPGNIGTTGTFPNGDYDTNNTNNLYTGDNSLTYTCSNGFTIATSALWKTASTSNHIVAFQPNQGGGAPNQLFHGLSFYDSGSSVIVPRALFNWDVGVATEDRSLITGNQTVANRFYSLACSHPGGSTGKLTLTVDGKRVITSTEDGSPLTPKRISIGHNVTSEDPVSRLNGIIQYVYAWERELSAHELIAIYENPWQLFKPSLSRFILIPDGAGGAITLSVQDSSHSQSVDNLSLVQSHVLAIEDILHSQSLESPLLTQAYSLAIQAADHSQTVDGELSLTQVFVLSPADTAQSQTSETPTLSTGLNLSPADTIHSQTVDALSLVQAHILTISDATHSQTSEPLNLGQDISLVVADTAQSQTSETPTLSIEFVLSILDAVHTQHVDNLSLATQVTLVVSDALHAHYAAAAAESTMTPAGRVFIVHAEDRVFLILGEDRTFGVA